MLKQRLADRDREVLRLRARAAMAEADGQAGDGYAGSSGGEVAYRSTYGGGGGGGGDSLRASALQTDPLRSSLTDSEFDAELAGRQRQHEHELEAMRRELSSKQAEISQFKQRLAGASIGGGR